MVRSLLVGLAVCTLVTSLVLISFGSALADESGFLSPGQDSSVGGEVGIRGIAAHPSFRKWQLDLMIDADPAKATFLAVGEVPAVAEQLLTSFDTARYPDGQHALRLRVVHSNLNYDEYLLPFAIDNGRERVGQSTVRAQPVDELVAPLLPPASTAIELPTVGRQPSVIVSPATVSARPKTDSHTLATRLDIPFDKEGRWIEVDLAAQTLRAWDGNTLFLQTLISSGQEETPTVQGVFTVNRKVPSQRMVGRDYELSDVPSVMYFFSNYAIHGAYWHSDFGERVSHGCVNMREDEAASLFDWASVGTPVFVHE